MGHSLCVDFFIFLALGVSGEGHVAYRHLVSSQTTRSTADRHAVLLCCSLEAVVFSIGAECRIDGYHHLVTLGHAKFQKLGRQPLLADDRYSHALSPRYRKP